MVTAVGGVAFIQDQQSGEGDTSNIQKKSAFQVPPNPVALQGVSQGKAAAVLIGTRPLKVGLSRSEQKKGKKGRLKAGAFQVPARRVQEQSAAQWTGMLLLFKEHRFSHTV